MLQAPSKPQVLVVSAAHLLSQMMLAPQPSDTEPHILPEHAVALIEGTHMHCPLVLHLWLVAQVPQEMLPPQPSDTELQTLVPQAAALVMAVQPQPLTPADPPLQVLGAVQVLVQVTACPQLLVAEPQAFPEQAAVLLGTH